MNGECHTSMSGILKSQNYTLKQLKFEEEAIRVLSKLPKIPPAKIKGKATSQK